MLCVTFSSFIFCLPVLTITLPRYILFLLRSEWMIRTSSRGLWDLQFICCLKLYQFSFIRALPTELQYPQDTDGTRTHDHEVNILKYICCMKTYQNAIFTSVKFQVRLLIICCLHSYEFQIKLENSRLLKWVLYSSLLSKFKLITGAWLFIKLRVPELWR